MRRYYWPPDKSLDSNTKIFLNYHSYYKLGLKILLKIAKVRGNRNFKHVYLSNLLFYVYKLIKNEEDWFSTFLAATSPVVIFQLTVPLKN